MPNQTVVAAVIPTALADEALDLVDRIRAASDPTRLRSEASEVVQRLTRVGLEAFFLRPVVRLGLGAVTESMVKVGLGTAGRVITTAIGRILGGLSGPQMLTVATLLEETLLEVDREGEWP
jgi:hypothetical protein